MSAENTRVLNDEVAAWFAERPLADMSPSTLRRYCIARWATRCTKAKLGQIDPLLPFTEAEQSGCHLLADDPLAHMESRGAQSQGEFWARVRHIIERATATT